LYSHHKFGKFRLSCIEVLSSEARRSNIALHPSPAQRTGRGIEERCGEDARPESPTSILR